MKVASIPQDVKVVANSAIKELGLAAPDNLLSSYSFLSFLPCVFLSTISLHSATSIAGFEDDQKTTTYVVEAFLVRFFPILSFYIFLFLQNA